MSDEKVNVKELAAELNVQPRELMRVLRELGVPAKSTVSMVAADDVQRVRDRFAGSKTGDGVDERRESQAGVIVRRRRVVADTSAAPDMEASAEPEVPAEKAFPPAEEEEEQGAVHEEPKAAPVSGKSDEEATPVVSKSSDTQKQEPPAETGLRQESVSSEGEGRVKAVKKSGGKRPVETPAARIISRPRPEPAVAGEPVVAPASPEAAMVAGQPEPAPAKVAVEVSSAPVEMSSQSAAPRVAETAGSSPVETGEPQKVEAPVEPVRRVRPAASAEPEGSSAPSLLPPVSEPRESKESREPKEPREQRDTREPREGRGERKPRRQEAAPSTPQVRIISRPDPVSVTASRDSRTNGGRDNGGRDNRRDDRHDGREDREGRNGGGARPSRNGGSARTGAMPGAVAGGMPPAFDGGREGQGKKKRNKNQNRRMMDFQSDDVMGRRHEDDDSEMPRVRGRRRPKSRDSRQVSQATQPIKAAKRKIRVEEAIRVADLAHQMGLKSGEIIKVLFSLGIMATINEALDIDTASVVAAEFGYEVEKVGFAEEDYLTQTTPDSEESLVRRPPVVTIMGHVDHGKTSLLDAIRKTNVTGGEAGGITQHIGAYFVKTKNGNIVFLDTPGHEAFTAMRARGAQVTDLVVLVVAADDGVMEQTREAVNHARAAGVPIMVAVNKIDKPEANPDRVLRELAEIGLVPEEWGGDTVVAKVSAKTREGLDELLELLALQAEILDLKANPNKPARGHIVEAKLDKGRGPVATVLIQEGTLHQGDSFVCGVFSGRARALFNDQGRKVKEAGPSCPVEVQGFEGVPDAGEEFVCLADEKLARRIAESRAIKQRERELARESRVTLETFLASSGDATETHTLNLVVKADVQGSLEAIVEALNKQSTDKVKIQVIHGGTGAITESDVLLASASSAIIIGFNVRPTAKVKDVAEHENVDIRFYDIIYKLVEEIKSAMAGLLAPVSREVYLGQAEVRRVYSVPKVGAVAGCIVSDGKVTRNAGVRLLRDSVVVYTGKLASLKRFKDDVREVQKGYECGISIENFNDIKEGDVLDLFETVTEAATL